MSHNIPTSVIAKAVENAILPTIREVEARFESGWDAGPYDGLEKRRPDEPYFALLARDPFTPALIEAWAFLRCGRTDEAMQRLRSALPLTEQFESQQDGDAKIRRAFEIADEAEQWRREWARKDGV